MNMEGAPLMTPTESAPVNDNTQTPSVASSIPLTPVDRIPEIEAADQVTREVSFSPPIVVEHPGDEDEAALTTIQPVTPATAVVTSDKSEVICVDTYDLLSMLTNLDFRAATVELERIVKICPNYIATSGLILKFIQRLNREHTNDPFMQALVIAAKNNPGTTPGSDPIRHYHSALIHQTAAIVKWLIERRFDSVDGTNFLIENMMQQKYICPSDPTSRTKVDIEHYTRIMDYSDLLRDLCQSVDIARISERVKLMLKDCPPFVFEILIRCGLDVNEKVADHSIAWWVMRSAEHAISFMDKQTLGYAFVTRLTNCSSFTFHPRSFTECSDYTVYGYLCKQKAFIDGLSDMIAPGLYYINTINDDRIIPDLINRGSPPKNQSIFHESLTNKINIIRGLYYNDPRLFTTFNQADELNAFAYFCQYGNYTPQHFECLKFIASNAPESAVEIVQDNDQINRQLYLCWTALHIACSRFSVATWIDKHLKARVPEMHLDTIDGIPNQHYSAQEEILEWLYTMYGTAHFKLDVYGRTPLMCMPIDMSPDGRTATKKIIERFVEHELRGLHALGHSITRLEYINFLTEWQRVENNSRMLDNKRRDMHANKRIVSSMAPWLKS